MILECVLEETSVVFLCTREGKNRCVKAMFLGKVSLSIVLIRYLVIIQRGNIYHNEMKERNKRKYYNPVKATLQPDLNGGYIIKSIST